MGLQAIAHACSYESPLSLPYIMHASMLTMNIYILSRGSIAYYYCFDVCIIQTYIGSVVVSVNPYKQLGIYGADVMEEYRGVNFFEMPPHM